MKDINYIIFEWKVVADAFEILNKKVNPNYYTKYPDGIFLKDVYNNDLPYAMEKLFVKWFVADFDKNDFYIQILINAYHQLQDVGYIGNKNA
jgi:hypothetical protein